MRTNIEIINVVSEVTGKSKRAEIAEFFNVPYTTLCTWIAREIPFKRLYGFAIENDISLDYLFLGEGNKNGTGKGVELVLFKAIETAFEQYRADNANSLSAYELAVVYNRVVMLVKQDIRQDEVIKQEIQYFLEIRAAQLNSRPRDEDSPHQTELEVTE